MATLHLPQKRPTSQLITKARNLMLEARNVDEAEGREFLYALSRCYAKRARREAHEALAVQAQADAAEREEAARREAEGTYEFRGRHQLPRMKLGAM